MTRKETARWVLIGLPTVGLASSMVVQSNGRASSDLLIALQWISANAVLFASVLAILSFVVNKSRFHLCLAIILFAAAVFEMVQAVNLARMFSPWVAGTPPGTSLLQVLNCFAYVGVLSSLIGQLYASLKHAARRAQNLFLAHEEVQDQIEERKWTEELLQESRLFAESIVESIREPLLVMDSELRIIRANRSFYTTFGLAPEKTLNQFLGALGHGEWNEPELLVQLKQIITAEGLLENYEVTQSFNGVGAKTLLLSARRINQKDVQTNLILLAMFDVTEQNLAQQELARRADELARSNAELEQFAYIASHDLQEPLRMVSSYCQLLKRRYQDKLDADANEFIEFAVDGAKRMQTLINDLLEYSRVGTCGQPFQPTDCGKVVEQALDNLRLSIDDCEARIQKSRMPMVLADEIQLVQLFQNLVANALKFRKGKAPDIAIKARRKNGTWIFSVKDTGIGIEQEFLQRIFVIFQRLHNPRNYPGTGIGLAICKKIVERHGGQIWVESKVGKGSTFCFTLPAVDREDINSG
ncbi:MAG: ATP-binding protein [bacterium]